VPRPTDGRREIDSAEWLGSKVAIDVQSGDLFDWRTNSYTPATLRFRAITILPPALPEPPKTRGVIDRHDLWIYLNVLFERDELPATVKDVQKLVAKRYGVTFEKAGLSGDLSRYMSAVRKGESERPKSSDRKQNQ
jgi:hypothetical protein